MLPFGVAMLSESIDFYFFIFFKGKNKSKLYDHFAMSFLFQGHLLLARNTAPSSYAFGL